MAGLKPGIALALAALGGLGAASAHAHPAQSFTVIDRTMVCKTQVAVSPGATIRTVDVSVGAERDEGPQQVPARLRLYTGVGAGAATLVFVESGVTSRRPYPVVVFNRRLCTRVKPRLSVVRVAGSAQSVESSVNCRLIDAPGKIVVRLHVAMQSPTHWSVFRRQYLRAQGKALESFFAVNTHPARKPIVFASFDRSGAARFFRAPGCTG